MDKHKSRWIDKKINFKNKERLNIAFPYFLKYLIMYFNELILFNKNALKYNMKLLKNDMKSDNIIL